MFSRRLFLSTAGAGAATTALGAPSIIRAQSLFREFPFSLGIASGEPSSDGFVLWTRIAPDPLDAHGGMGMAPMAVQWEVASDDRFATIVAHGEAIARPELAHSVHVEVVGLEANRPYYYRFTAGGERSFRGAARTLPRADADVARLKFGVAGCQNYEDGFYGAYRHLAREADLAFVYHYGDYIYEYRGSPTGASWWSGGLNVPVREAIGQVCMDVGDYRLRYAQAKMDVDLQRAHAAHTFVTSYDDHEIANNWVQDIDPGGADPAVFAMRRAGAFQAWYEHMPVRRSSLPRGGVVDHYRSLRYGRLAEIDVLNTRLYRTDQPCEDGFKPHCSGVDEAQAHVLGSEQEAWLAHNLSRNQARWNCLAQQIMMMSLDRRRRPEEPARVMNLDSWAGYEVPRQRMLARMHGLGNVVVLTGDEHQNFAGLLTHRDQIVGAEFVATSISSGGDGSDLRTGSDVFLANNPEVKFINDQRGYLTCEVTPEAWATHFNVVDRVSSSNNQLSRRATATVAHGAPDMVIR
ncbi:MAG: alkaline phosphatase D family protein [Sphingopyxis sp.]